MCLRDENELVRKQALMLLTQLIQEDYIKWKNGALFFRFIVSLVDDSLDVRQYGMCVPISIVCEKDIVYLFEFFSVF
jgi:condensin-2 complex subunit D3